MPLGATGTVSGACAIVGKSRMSAYRLRNRADAGAFRAAWDEALRSVTAILADTAYERALEGVVEDVWHKGQKVGERRRFNDRLLMFLLRVRDPHGYAPIDQLDRALRRKALPADGALARARDAVGPAEEAWGLKLEPGGEAPAVARLSAPPPCAIPLPPSTGGLPAPAALPPASDEAPDTAPPPDGETPSHV